MGNPNIWKISEKLFRRKIRNAIESFRNVGWWKAWRSIAGMMMKIMLGSNKQWPIESEERNSIIKFGFWIACVCGLTLMINNVTMTKWKQNLSKRPKGQRQVYVRHFPAPAPFSMYYWPGRRIRHRFTHRLPMVWDRIRCAIEPYVSMRLLHPADHSDDLQQSIWPFDN